MSDRPTFPTLELAGPGGTISFPGDPFEAIGTVCRLLAADEVDHYEAALAVLGHARRIGEHYGCELLGEGSSDPVDQ